MNIGHVDSSALKNVDAIFESARLLEEAIFESARLLEEAIFVLADVLEPELLSTMILLTARLDSLGKAARKCVMQKAIA